MRQIIYSMQFKGQATPIREGVLKATTTAPSCRLMTVAGPEGVHGVVEKVAGDPVSFESEVTFRGETSFHEEGTITFGTNGHRLRFSTVGQGYLGASADPVQKQGGVTWTVEGGEGQFAGASGLITSNFLVGAAGEVVDHHVGVIFVE